MAKIAIVAIAYLEQQSPLDIALSPAQVGLELKWLWLDECVHHASDHQLLFRHIIQAPRGSRHTWMLLDSKSSVTVEVNLDLEIVHNHQCRGVITEGSSCRLDVGDDYLPAYRIMVSSFD